MTEIGGSIHPLTIRLPSGVDLPGRGPVVVIGPNGSGKTRRARDLVAESGLEFINAQRNTRIQPNVPAMSYTDAENQFNGQRDQSRTNHWDINNDFDYLLASLLAQHATTAIKFMDAVRAGEADATTITDDTLQRIRDLWAEVFPGRKLAIEEYRPVIRSTLGGDEIQYSAQMMSDGERAAVYLAGRVLRATPGVLVIDEPETHLHSLLAIRFWDILEAARPDVRFVYITHDLTFARSRREARYVLASPVDGLQLLPPTEGLSDEVAEILLGAASLSFYARRLIFCEGEIGDRDENLYRAWFNDRSTVVRAVGSCDMVRRCSATVEGGWLVGNLQAVGIIDRDFHPDEYLAALPAGVTPLSLHEVESLYCLPGVVSAVARHLHHPYDAATYLGQLRASVNETERHKVILERWKRRVEPRLIAVVGSVQSRAESLETIVQSLPGIFEPSSWGFSPHDLLEEEKIRVEAASRTGTVEDFLRLLPGKGRAAAAATYLGQSLDGYIHLVNESLANDGDEGLGGSIAGALAPLLPARQMSYQAEPGGGDPATATAQTPYSTP